MESYSFFLNETPVCVEAEPTETLLHVLRNRLGMTGVKEGCAQGECGACTVLLDDAAVASCILLIGQAAGRRITTIEGLAKNGELDALQRAFIDAGAIQCGFCTPGMILSAKALLIRNPHPSREEIRTALSGNLCRCTGYTKIIRAVESAVEFSGEGRADA